jgi:aminopeptidase N
MGSESHEPLSLTVSLDFLPVTGFHDLSGAGYELVTDLILGFDAVNAKVSASLASAFNSWRRYDTTHQERMQTQLKLLSSKEGVSRNLFEIFKKALG